MAYQFETIKVLVVEDTKPMLLMIKSILQTFGIKDVLTASDGEEAYKVFRHHNPDLVIADWMMEPVDGIKLCEWIRERADSPNRFVPFILMTGYSERKRVFAARDVGATEFLVKPFTAQDIFKRISQIVERPRQFVESEDFFGPDRRRKSDSFSGMNRRDRKPATNKPVIGSDDIIDFD